MKLYSLSEINEIKSAVIFSRIQAGQLVNVDLIYNEEDNRLYYWYMTTTGENEGLIGLPLLMETLQFMPGVIAFDCNAVKYEHVNRRKIFSFTYSFVEYFNSISKYDQFLFVSTALRLLKQSKALVNAN